MLPYEFNHRSSGPAGAALRRRYFGSLAAPESYCSEDRQNRPSQQSVIRGWCNRNLCIILGKRQITGRGLGCHFFTTVLLNDQRLCFPCNDSTTEQLRMSGVSPDLNLSDMHG